MGDFINYLEQRVEHTKLALQAITEQIQKASAEREVLMADLAGYERTLSAERRIHGIDTGTPEAEVVRHNGAGKSWTQITTEAVNKADFARQFVRDNPNGLLPRDILRGFEKAGIPIGRPYIYALVQRLQKQGAIRQHRDKWYPVLESDKPDLTSEL
jgi:hypothetical protein